MDMQTDTETDAEFVREGAFPFLDLPLEVRRRCYELMFRCSSIHATTPSQGPVTITPNPDDPNHLTGILAVNKQIRQEGSPIFYSLARLVVGIHETGRMDAQLTRFRSVSPNAPVENIYVFQRELETPFLLNNFSTLRYLEWSVPGYLGFLTNPGDIDGWLDAFTADQILGFFRPNHQLKLIPRHVMFVIVVRLEHNYTQSVNMAIDVHARIVIGWQIHGQPAVMKA